MKFRIRRSYDEFKPEVWYVGPNRQSYWVEIGNYHCYTLEDARKVCHDYKRMKDNPVVEEFEL